MKGVRDDAGVFSQKIRIIPGTDLVLTPPEEINEELRYWLSTYQHCASIFDIARAHAHFEIIHPFCDGNGRIGRLIILSQCAKISLPPPLINNKNKALYYVTLEYAQQTGDVNPLATFFMEAIFDLHNRFRGKESNAVRFFR